MVKKKSKPTKLQSTISIKPSFIPTGKNGIETSDPPPPPARGVHQHPVHEDISEQDNHHQQQQQQQPFRKFKATGRKQQPHRESLWCVAWSDDIHVTEAEPDEDSKRYRYLATCGTNEVTIYEVEIDNARGTFAYKQRYKDTDGEEMFFTCVYGGRSRYWPEAKEYNGSDTSSDEDDDEDRKPRASVKRPRPPPPPDDDDDNDNDPKSTIGKYTSNNNEYYGGTEPFHYTGPQLLCAAGYRGVIKVIDPVRTELVAQLRGHGMDIYDLRVSPTNEYQLLSASVDESIRLWNLQSFACVAIFTGLHGHREDVLSVSWHATGDRFVSSGKDRTIRIWDMTQGRVPEAFQASHKITPVHQNRRESFQPLFVEFPVFATNKVHINYVDCVQFVGDAILSRSTYNSIVLWLPVIPEPTTKAGKSTACSPPSDVIELRIFDLDYCDIWFLRFATDSNSRLLAMGNYKGEVDIWDIDSSNERPVQRLQAIMASTIRMLAFSPDGKTLVACNDNACVCKWDIP